MATATLASASISQTIAALGIDPDTYIQFGIPPELRPPEPAIDLSFMDQPVNLSDRAITALTIDSLPDSGKRAQRLLNCEAFKCYHSCGLHTWGQISSHCELTIACPGCAMRMAQEQFDKYIHLETFARDANGYTLFTFRPPQSALDESQGPKEFFTRLGKMLSRVLDKAPTLAKVKVLSGRIEVMYLGPVSIDQLRELQGMYPSFRYRRVTDPGNFPRDLRDLLAPELPTDPVQLGQLDYKYRKVRQLRVWGMSRDERKKLSVLSTPSTDNSPSKDTDGVPLCPKCRARAIKSSEWTCHSTPISKVRWLDHPAVG